MSDQIGLLLISSYHRYLLGARRDIRTVPGHRYTVLDYVLTEAGDILALLTTINISGPWGHLTPHISLYRNSYSIILYYS